MGWSSTFPLAEGTDLQDWHFWQQFYLALEEKAKGLGSPRWPREWRNILFDLDSGTIIAATATHIYSSKDYPDTPGTWYRPPVWPGQPPKNWPYYQWEIVIDSPGKPWECWRLSAEPDPQANALGCNVGAWMDMERGTATTLGANGQPLPPGQFRSAGKDFGGNRYGSYWTTYVTGGVTKTVRCARTEGDIVVLPDADVVDEGSIFHFGLIREPADLVGKRYFIQRRNAVDWSRRWMEPPYNPAGGRIPGGPMFAWYRGWPVGDYQTTGGAEKRSFWTVDPATDGWRQTRAPSGDAISKAYSTYDGINTYDFNIPSDDVWGHFPGIDTAVDADCWAPCMTEITQTNWGRCFTIDLYKSIRGLQVGTLEMGQSYIAPDDQPPWDYVPHLLPVDLMPAASEIACYSGSSADATFPTVKPHATIFYAVVTGTRTVVTADPLIYSPWRYSRSAGMTVADEHGNWSVPLTNNDTQTQTIQARLGFTRKWPRQVRNMFYPRTVFVPHYIPRTGYYYGTVMVEDYGPVDPPSNQINDRDGEGNPQTGFPEVGRWVTRPIDATYLDDEAFVEGEIARELGDTWDDIQWADWAGQAGAWASQYDPLRNPPPLRQYVGAAIHRLSSADKDRAYRYEDKDGVRTHYAPLNPRALDVKGTVLDGGDGWLRCSDTQGWAGTMIQHEGIATGGGSTFLLNAAKVGNPFWQKENALGSTGRWEGFVVEVETSSGHYEHRVIEAFSEAQQKLQWTRPLSERGTASHVALGQLRCEGRQWLLDHWAGKAVAAFAAGERVTVTVQANTADTLIFSTSVLVDAGSVFEIQGIEVAAGMRYRIREPRCEPDKGLNTWQDHAITITHPDGSTETGMLTHSNDTHLWGTGFTARPGDTWTIEVKMPGQCWLRRNGAWIKPPTDEADPRDPAGRPWPDDQTSIHPTTASYFGLYENHDYVGVWLANELKSAISMMRKTTVGASWTDSLAQSLMKWYSPGWWNGFEGSPEDVWNEAYGFIAGEWDAGMINPIFDEWGEVIGYETPESVPGQPPYCVGYGTMWGGDYNHDGSLGPSGYDNGNGTDNVQTEEFDLARVASRLSVRPPNLLPVASIDAWVYARRPFPQYPWLNGGWPVGECELIWDDNGSGLTEDRWNPIAGFALQDDSWYKSELIGAVGPKPDLDMPAPLVTQNEDQDPGLEPLTYYAWMAVQGYQVTDKIAVVSWSMEYL